MNRPSIKTLGAAGACASLLLLAGCSSQPASGPNANQPKGGASQSSQLEDQMVLGFYGGVIGDAFKKVFVDTCSASLGVDIVYEQDFDGPRLTKMQAGGSDIDVAIFTDPIMPDVRAAGLTTPLPQDEIPNYAKVPDDFKTDDSVAVSLAIWGIAYNGEKVSPAPTSWKDLLDGKYKGKVTASDITYNSSYLTLAAFEDLTGGNMATDPEPGFKMMKQLRDNSSSFWSSSSDMLQQLQAGSVVMSPYASGSTAIAATEPGGENVKFVAPTEGAYPVGFNMVLSAGAKAPKAGAAFINCVLDAENQAKWVDLYPSFPANSEATVPDSAKAWLGGVEKVSDLKLVDWDAISKAKDDIVGTWQREIG